MDRSTKILNKIIKNSSDSQKGNILWVWFIQGMYINLSIKIQLT